MTEERWDMHAPPPKPNSENLVLGDNTRSSHMNLISVQLPNITCTLLNTEFFKLLFLACHYVDAYFQDTDLPGCFTGLHVRSLRTYPPAKRRAAETSNFAVANFLN